MIVEMSEWILGRGVLKPFANGLDGGVRKREESKEDLLVWGWTCTSWEDWGRAGL